MHKRDKGPSRDTGQEAESLLREIEWSARDKKRWLEPFMGRDEGWKSCTKFPCGLSLPCLLTQGETGHPNRYFFLGQPGKEERDCLSPCRNPVSWVRHSITIHEEGVKEKNPLRCWRAASAAQNTYSLYRGPVFDSQDPRGGLQQSVTLFWGSNSFLFMGPAHTWCTKAYTEANHSSTDSKRNNYRKRN